MTTYVQVPTTKIGYTIYSISDDVPDKDLFIEKLINNDDDDELEDLLEDLEEEFFIEEEINEDFSGTEEISEEEFENTKSMADMVFVDR